MAIASDASPPASEFESPWSEQNNFSRASEANHRFFRTSSGSLAMFAAMGLSKPSKNQRLSQDRRVYLSLATSAPPRSFTMIQASLRSSTVHGCGKRRRPLAAWLPLSTLVMAQGRPCMAVIRLTVVALIVSALCVVAHAQEAKPCPSGHICPVCSEENGIRTCRVERPGQPALPQAAASAPRNILPPSSAAPSPPPQSPGFHVWGM
jgi:hypothetical protein